MLKKTVLISILGYFSAYASADYSTCTINSRIYEIYMSTLRELRPIECDIASGGVQLPISDKFTAVPTSCDGRPISITLSCKGSNSGNGFVKTSCVAEGRTLTQNFLASSCNSLNDSCKATYEDGAAMGDSLIKMEYQISNCK